MRYVQRLRLVLHCSWYRFYEDRLRLCLLVFVARQPLLCRMDDSRLVAVPPATGRVACAVLDAAYRHQTLVCWMLPTLARCYGHQPHTRAL